MCLELLFLLWNDEIWSCFLFPFSLFFPGFSYSYENVQSFKSRKILIYIFKKRLWIIFYKLFKLNFGYINWKINYFFK